MSIKMLLTPD